MKLVSTIFSVLLITIFLQGQTVCEGGFAGIYPCNEVDLMSHLTIDEMGGSGPSGCNDIWGWTDPISGNEYAIVGKDAGTAFVNVTDPLNPIYLGTLPTHTDTSLWRDIKVIGNYAFIGSEAPGHGLQIFDLMRLTEVVNPETFTEDAHYDMYGNSHNTVANEESNYIFAVGSNTFSGGPHFVDVSDPLNPTAAGGFSDAGYCHDAQVVNYNGPDEAYIGKEIYFGCHGSSGVPFNIVDVSDKTDAYLISGATYENHVYSHQGWLTQDHKYFLMNDEIDESTFGYNTRTRIWDVQDLDNPEMIGFYEHDIPVIDHNLYVRGDYAFMSNYEGGLRIVDLTDIANVNLETIAYFDVHPESNAASYAGTWSNYPYFGSGNIILTHRANGLFIVRPSNVDLTTSISEVDDEVDISIYPNPSNDFLSVNFESGEFIERYAIFDARGQLIDQSNVNSTTNVSIEIGHFAKGVYTIQFNNGSANAQFIKK